MMKTVYRISKEKYIRDLSGLGAKLYGGRWNRPGLSMLYTSQARSLAMLELIVHFNSQSALEQQYNFAVITIDESQIVALDIAIAAFDFNRPNNGQLWRITDEQFLDNNVLCLKVPSVLVPAESNYLLNPNHTSFNSVKLVNVEDAVIDKRYYGLTGLTS